MNISSGYPRSCDRSQSLARQRGVIRIGAAITALVVVGGFSTLSVPAAFAATSASTSGLAPIAPAVPVSAMPATFDAGRYIVTLHDDAVAAYTGGIAKFRATQPTDRSELDVSSRRVVDYSDYLVGQQKAVAASVKAVITTNYTITTNGFSSNLTSAQAKGLASDPRVASVVPDELLHLQATSSTDFLGLSGDDGVWAKTGGQKSAGEGVVVGIVDSGISPENASFAGKQLGSVAGAEPYRDGTAVVFKKADGQTFRGECVTGPGFAASDCSTKLITARYFVDNYNAVAVGPHDFISPRDGTGHGSHTASTAAGNADVDATVAGRDFGNISGVVPGAKIAMYKACWSGVTHEDDGCQTGDLLAAIEAAVADGVDVINFSIGAGAAQTTVSLTDEAFLNAAAVGVFVATSAGNDGDKGASTADNAAPWITTVAASTIPSYAATVKLGDGRSILGGSITVPADAPLAGPFVEAAMVAVEGADDPQLCGPGTLDGAKVAGKIVLCDRGVVDRTAKSAEVRRAGGIGVVIVNPTASSVDLDTHALPTVHVDVDGYRALHDYAARSGSTVTLEDGNPADLPAPPAPQVAGFSSRGPILADGGDVLKPDIAAPGVAILAAFSSEPDAPGNYALLSGTSMASPHIAGLAALYLGEHPDASPSEIKSAMMTTAYDTTDASGMPMADPFIQGAGQADPTRYLEPGMLYLNDVDDWYGYIESVSKVDLGVDAIDPSDLNLPSISVGGLAGTQTVSRTVTSTRAGDYVVTAPTLSGIDTVVTPSTLSFGAAGEEKTYTVSFTRNTAPLDKFVTGQLIWHAASDSADTVTMPIAVRPVSLQVPAVATGKGASGSLEIPVSAGSTEEFGITKTGLVKGEVMYGSGTAAPIGQPVRFDRFVVDVPDHTSLAHFVLDGADDSGDLDLHLSSLDSAGQLIPWKDSATSSSHEVIDYAGLPPNRYVLDVAFFSGKGDLDYTLTSYVLGTTTNDGALTVTPETLQTTLGKPASVGVSWSGLDVGASYYGQIDFGDSGHSTALEITVPGAAPAPSGEPTIDFDRAWARPGADVELDVSGLAASERFTVTMDDSTILTGVAGPEGTSRRSFQLAADLALGEHPVTMTAADGKASTTLHITDLVILSANEVLDVSADGSPVAAIDMEFAGHGELRLTVSGSAGVAYEGAYDVEMDPVLYTDTRRSDSMTLAPGVYTVEIVATTPVPDMREQHLEYSFIVETGQASDVAITQNPQRANFADLRYLNRSSSSVHANLRYKLCAGPVVVAAVAIDEKDGEIFTQTFDMNGKASVELLTDDGKVLASYINPAIDRCTGAAAITQDYWMTFSDTPTDAPGEGPVSLVFSNRYPLHTGGFDFKAGFGSDVEGPEFYAEKISHGETTTVGPIVEVPLRVPEGQPVWSRATYEINDGTVVAQAIRRVLSPQITLAMLQPVSNAEAPGQPQPGDGQPGSGIPGGDNGPSGTGQNGDLASTGASVAAAIAAAAALLALGIALTVARRKRRRSV